jgi:hypothetical protein
MQTPIGPNPSGLEQELRARYLRRHVEARPAWGWTDPLSAPSFVAALARAGCSRLRGCVPRQRSTRAPTKSNEQTDGSGSVVTRRQRLWSKTFVWPETAVTDLEVT